MPDSLKIIFAGTPEFAAEVLQGLLQSPHEICAVYSQPDRPAGRGRKVKASAVKELALAHNIAVHQPLSLKDPQEQQRLRDYAADIMVVVAYGLILPKVVLSAPRLGCINVHASLLPRWRGAAPIQRAIQAGDKQTGVTIMQMDEGLDTGDMLLKAETPIYPDDTAQTLHDRLAQLGRDALLDSLNQLGSRGLSAKAQDDSLASYAHKISKSEAPIDWRQPAAQIHNHIRAFNPWPIASSLIDGQILRIWLSELINDTSIDTVTATPGMVVGESKLGIDVAAGDGCVLRLLIMQLPGGKPLAARDFVNANSLLGKILS